MPASPFVPRFVRAEKVGRVGGSTFEFAWFRLSEKSAQAHHGGRISCKTSTCRLPAVWVWVFQANIAFEGVLGYL
jgi:hypothetical protein